MNNNLRNIVEHYVNSSLQPNLSLAESMYVFHRGAERAYGYLALCGDGKVRNAETWHGMNDARTYRLTASANGSLRNLARI